LHPQAVPGEKGLVLPAFRAKVQAAVGQDTVDGGEGDDVFPDYPLRPADPYARAQMRIWTKWVDEYFCWCVSTIGWERMVSRMARAVSDEEFDRLVERIPLKECVEWLTHVCQAIDFAHKELVRRYLAAGDDGRRAVETLAAGLKAYASWHNLATLQDYQSARASSYDKTGQNTDYLEIKPWSTVEFGNLEGPGCVTRIWMALNSDEIVWQSSLRFLADTFICIMIRTIWKAYA